MLEYIDGEMEGWSELLKDATNPKFILKCSTGHMLESPIMLSQREVDQRCFTCEEMISQGGFYKIKRA